MWHKVFLPLNGYLIHVVKQYCLSSIHFSPWQWWLHCWSCMIFLSQVQFCTFHCNGKHTMLCGGLLTSIYCQLLLFSTFVHPCPHIQSPPYCFFSVVVSFFWRNGWSRHIWCVTLLNHIMDLQVLSLGNLVPDEPCCVFYATECHVYWDLTHNEVFPSTLIWYHTKTHSTIRVNRLTDPY